MAERDAPASGPGAADAPPGRLVIILRSPTDADSDEQQQVWSPEQWRRCGERLRAQQAKVCLVLVDPSLGKHVKTASDGLLWAKTEEEAEGAIAACLAPYAELAQRLEVQDAITDELSEPVRRVARGIHLLAEATDSACLKLHLACERVYDAVVTRFLCNTCQTGCVLAFSQVLDDLDVGSLTATKNHSASRRVAEWFDSFQQPVLSTSGGELASSKAMWLAAALGAPIQVWNTNGGLFSADIRKVPEARLIRSMSYEEAREHCGINWELLHPRCIDVAQLNQVAITLVCPWLDGDRGTTQIQALPVPDQPCVKSVVVQHDVVLWSLTSGSMWRVAGFLSRIFAIFERSSISIDLVATGDTNLTVSLEQVDRPLDPQVLSEVMRELSRSCEVAVIGRCGIATLIGARMGSAIGKLGGQLFQQQIHLITKPARDISMSIVVPDSPDLERTVYQAMLAPGDDGSDCFGPSWLSLHGKDELRRGKPTIMTQQPSQDRWWLARTRELIAMAPPNRPAYVYSRERMVQRIQQLKSLRAVTQVFYAIKANSHPELLKAAESEGLGFECVSLAEVEHVMGLFPSMKPERILFTPNFASQAEYSEGFVRGVNVTVDNIFCVREWAEVFQGRKVFLRIDPGQGRGHHKHVRTAGKDSKFGISQDELEQCAALCHEHDVHVVGLHCHSGSGVPDATLWQQHAQTLVDCAAMFPEVTTLDLGGGFHIPYHEDTVPVDLRQVADSLAAFKKANPKFDIWLEPGRFISAECGVLLTRATQFKDKGSFKYMGVTAGMNSLIRPALYGSYHGIHNLTSIAGRDPADTAVEGMMATIVGPICESADVFGRDRIIPADTRPGNVFLIDCVGAYGRSMASSYNMREPGQEIVI